MWYCSECERQYETPKVGREFVGEIGHGGNVEYPICPTCKGGGDIEELKRLPHVQRELHNQRKRPLPPLAKKLQLCG